MILIALMITGFLFMIAVVQLMIELNRPKGSINEKT